MRYEVGHVQRTGKFSVRERRLYYVRDRVTQRLVEIDERYRNIYTSRRRIAIERSETLEVLNRLPGVPLGGLSQSSYS